MKRNAFGQLVPVNPRLRFFAPAEGEGGGDEGFKAPESQEELNKLINGAVARTHKQYEPLKEKASKWDAHEAESNKPKPGETQTDKTNDAPTGVSTDDVQKQIADALAAERKELALERVSDRLDKALEGRNVSASKLFALDRAQFIKEDGKNVDQDALTEWVKENSTEVAGPSPRRLRGQGERDSNVTGGSVQAGRDLFDSAKKPTRKD